MGTHALLSDKITYSNLGLLVVDEEQRFGVKQKEKIKGASTHVDVLSLTATPIPRTFYMCATGIRDMSLLATPPTGRLKVEAEAVTTCYHMILTLTLALILTLTLTLTLTLPLTLTLTLTP